MSASFLKLAALLILLMIVGYLAHHYMLLTALSPDAVRGFLSTQPTVQSLVLFSLLYALVTVLFLPGTPFTILAGVLFGTFTGTAVVVVGASVGAFLAFMLSRFFGKDAVESLLSTYAHRLYEYDKKLEQHGLITMLFLRLVPLFPFNALNFVLGLTKVRKRDYMIGTVVGIIPGTFAYVYFGNVIAMPTVLGVVVAVLWFVLLFVISSLLPRLMSRSSYDYDVVVIGAGAAGLNIAGFLRRVGCKTLIIEKDEGNIGGDCLNSGCVPSKGLIHIAKQVHTARSLSELGITAKGRVSFDKVRELLTQAQQIFREKESAEYLRSLGHEVIIGSASFAGPHSVLVEGKTYSGRKIVIATGSSPRKLSVPGATLPHVIYNTEVFMLDTLPAELVVIGAGPIGLELGQAFARLGSKVTIVNNTDTLLPAYEKEAGEVLYTAMTKEGIDFCMNSTVTEITPHDVVVTSNSSTTHIKADMVLVAIGRELSVESMSLQKAGIAHTGNKIVHDEFMRTSNKHVYVVGDAAGEGQFTHLTELHARVVLRTFFSPRPFWTKLSLDTFANVMYTSPALATFGLQENQLKERKQFYTKEVFSLRDDDRSIIEHATHGYISLYIGKNGEIHGGTLVSDFAGEIVRELILATAKGLRVKDLLETTYPYPIHARAILSLCRAYESRRLTKTTRRILKALFN